MSETEEYFQDYTAFSRDLRVWLIAYGIGAPVLFVSNAAIYDKVLQHGDGKLIVILFLIGVSFQIFEASTSKWMSWIQYSCKIDKKHKHLRPLADYWFNRIIPRFVVELLSIVSMVYATYLTFGIITNA